MDTMEGRKDDEEIEGGEGIFRRTLGEEMKISNGVRETVYSFRLVVENRDGIWQERSETRIKIRNFNCFEVDAK